jgi:multidrug efflux pump subunit AcrA (membrane-fusion protein)
LPAASLNSVAEGEMVTAGQVVARVDVRDLGAALRRAEASCCTPGPASAAAH